jgi:hypothetical protein
MNILGTPTTAVWKEGTVLTNNLNIHLPSSSPINLTTLLPTSAIELIRKMLAWNPQARFGQWDE